VDEAQGARGADVSSDKTAAETVATSTTKIHSRQVDPRASQAALSATYANTPIRSASSAITVMQSRKRGWERSDRLTAPCTPTPHGRRLTVITGSPLT
jgi:hypothetical protein